MTSNLNNKQKYKSTASLMLPLYVVAEKKLSKWGFFFPNFGYIWLGTGSNNNKNNGVAPGKCPLRVSLPSLGGGSRCLF